MVLTWRGRPRAVLIDYDAYSEITIRQAALEEARDAFPLLRAKETVTDTPLQSARRSISITVQGATPA